MIQKRYNFKNGKCLEKLLKWAKNVNRFLYTNMPLWQYSKIIRKVFNAQKKVKNMYWRVR